MSSKHWKKGRGKLGIFEPLLGNWVANENSKDRMNCRCDRSFTKTLGGKYIQLKADWHLGDKLYEDHTLFGVNAHKAVCFWSFQSDGKQATGELTEAPDIHEDAVAFIAQMPAGTARQVYWPDDEGGFYWVVQSKTKKGWNEIVHHHYKRQNG